MWKRHQEAKDVLKMGNRTLWQNKTTNGIAMRENNKAKRTLCDPQQRDDQPKHYQSLLYRTMRAATNMRPAMRPVEYWVISPSTAAALVEVPAAAADEVAEADESVEVDTARVVLALAEVEEEEVVLVSLAFLVPQFMAFLQARWPSASSGCDLMHWP